LSSISDSSQRKTFGSNFQTQTAIVKWLADLQLAEDEKMAAIAKEKYGDAFASIFTYKKHGKTYVKSKSAHIAE